MTSEIKMYERPEEYNGSTLGGSAQTVQAAIAALNSRFTTLQSYTPTFTWGDGTAPTVANISFAYAQCGTFLWVAGRFNITDKGTPSTTSTSLIITIPDGFTLSDSTPPAGVGQLTPQNTNVPSILIARKTGNNVNIAYGGSGGYSYNYLATGYYSLSCFLPLAS